MNALLTLHMLVVVEDEEDAASKAILMENSCRHGMHAALEQNEHYVESGMSFEDVEKLAKMLGVSVTIIPEMAEIA